MTVFLLGANHDTAAVAVRECLAIPAERIVDTLRFLAPSTGELAVISTCNRTEFYAASSDAERKLRDFIYRHSQLDEGVLDHALYRLEGRDAVRHLLRVSCGLNSMVVGEPQILGQVREALQLAQEANAAGPVINGLFQTALNAGKTARALTGISQGALSVSQAAVDLAREKLGDLEGRTALVIGAGETGAIVAHSLKSRGVGRLIVANRTFERAQHLAADLYGEAVELRVLPMVVNQADIVIACTGAPEALITPEVVLAQREALPAGNTLMIDIAIPRDIDPRVAEIPGVTVCDLDDLQALIQTNLERRKSIAVDIEHDVDARTTAFMSWMSGHSAGKTIRDLYDHAEQVRADQVLRVLRKLCDLSDREREQIEIFSSQLVNALLHQPVSQIWDHQIGASNADAIRRLFGLDEPSPAPVTESTPQSRTSPAA